MKFLIMLLLLSCVAKKEIKPSVPEKVTPKKNVKRKGVTQ